MASWMAEKKQKGLVCPVCLDVFKDPTILSCGHTFCKTCLISYDRLRFDDCNYIVCAICRKTTSLGPDRIAGLTPNLLVKGLLDVPVEDRAPNFCPAHPHLSKDFVCKGCAEVMCFECYIDNHESLLHNMKKKEEVEEDIKMNLDALIEEGRMKIIELEKCKNEAEQQREILNCYFGYLEIQIRDAFSKKAKILEQNLAKQLARLDRISSTCYDELKLFIHYRIENAIDSLDTSIKILTENTKNYSELHTCHFCELQKSLEEVFNYNSTSEVTQVTEITEAAERWQFHPSDGNLLDLGCLKSSDESWY